MQHIDELPAGKLVADADASRADYFRRFHNVDQELPIHYDVVVNTDVLSPEVGADLVALAARET